MRSSQRLKRLIEAADQFWRRAPVRSSGYPDDVVDLVIFHKLHFHMAPEQAWKCFSQLKSEFVDWNEVRISVVREIQEQLEDGGDSLELAVFIKDFLEFVHKEVRRVTLTPVIEGNLTQIRRFFRKIKGVEPATIELVLLRAKGYPVVPLSGEMERVLDSLGVVRSRASREYKSKRLFEVVGPEKALSVHHYLLFHGHASAEGRSAGNGGRSAGNGKRELSPSLVAGRGLRGATQASRTTVVRTPIAGKRVRNGTARRARVHAGRGAFSSARRK